MNVSLLCLPRPTSLLLGALLIDTATQTLQAEAKSSNGKEAPGKSYVQERHQGRIVFMAQALERRYGVKTVPEARDRVLALETREGRLIPLFEDIRGRAFRTDERLRKMQVELEVRRYVGSPAIQIIRMFEINNKEKLIVDYWCDICSIVMFEMGPCACCQDDNRLRKRKVPSSTK